MTSYRDYPYQSVLAPYMRDYVSQMRALGFIYNVKAYQLYRFDLYWSEQGFEDASITLERINEWLKALPGESRSSHSSRIGAVRAMSVYLNTLGIACYVPVENVGRDYRKVHILSKSETKEFFEVIEIPHLEDDGR